MKPRIVKADDKVAACHGRIAVERGPLVYCAEWADNDYDLFRFVFDADSSMTVTDSPGLLGGIKMITARGTLLDQTPDGRINTANRTVKLIPYYAWCHRGPGKMIVWMADGLGVMDEY